MLLLIEVHLIDADSVPFPVTPNQELRRHRLECMQFSLKAADAKGSEKVEKSKQNEGANNK